MNTYGYAMQNPVNYTDPSGLISFPAGVRRCIGNICLPSAIPDIFRPTQEFAAAANEIRGNIECEAKCTVELILGEASSVSVQKAVESQTKKILSSFAFEVGKHVLSRVFTVGTFISAGNALNCVITCSEEGDDCGL